MLFDRIAHFADVQPAAAALSAPGEMPICYGELPGILSGMRQWLAGQPGGGGGVVGLVMPDGPALALTLLGCSMQGTMAPINPSFTAGEMEELLRHMGATAVVAHAGAHAAREAAARLGIPAWTPPGPGTLRKDAAAPPAAMGRVPDDHVMVMLQTSGTTGRSKRVPLRMANIGGQARNMSDSMGLGPEDASLVFMPLFHMHGFSCVLASFWGGGRAVCTPGYTPEHFDAWLRGERPTWYSCVPTVHDDICRLAESGQLSAGHALRFVRSLSAPLPDELKERTQKAMGVPLVEHYGLSEALSPLTTMDAGSPRHSLGKAYRCRLLIADAQGEAVPAGSEGEILVSGDVVVPGYADGEAFNRAHYHGPWLRTGDRGWMDADGNLYLTGRIKELINRGGEKISPQEVERAVAQYPGIKQVAAFGMPHPTLGQEVALAYTVTGAEVNEQALRRWMLGRLAAHRLPKRLVRLPQLPTTATGKVKRAELAELLGLNGPLASTATGEAADSKGGSPEQGPVTHLEQQVAFLWAQALRREEISLNDDFFALGGDSLSAVQLCNRLKELYGYEATLAQLYCAPTLAMFTAMLALQSPRNSWANLAPIRMQGSLVPFVCIHGDEGNYTLPRHLNPDRPFIGFVHQGEDGRGMKHKTIPAIAHHYVEELIAALPEGPVILAGFSMGGIIAYEMAQMLVQRGRQVPLLLLIDSRGPGFPWLRYAPKVRMADAKALLLMPKLERALNRGEVLPFAQRNFYIINTYRRAVASYVPVPYSGDVLLVRSSQRMGSEPTGWNGLKAGNWHTEQVEGTHLTVLREPLVRGLVDLVKRQLKERGL